MKHLVPPLPYDVAALEPHIDARTMALHHDKHHAAYVAQLNAAIEHFPELHERSAAWLLLNLNKVPEEARTAVRNSAGGHVNHSLFWRAMSPDANAAPAGHLADAINRDFGNLDHFKARFEEAASEVLGSGWIWLARAQQNGGRLRIFTTSGHGNPLMQGHFPILVNDVWEHAYYLKHENRRAEYLKAWWAVANWDEAARRFQRSDHKAPNHWAAEGELLLETTTCVT
jgi:superoxide dismutase, Fe-Mn family